MKTFLIGYDVKNVFTCDNFGLSNESTLCPAKHTVNDQINASYLINAPSTPLKRY